MANIQDVARMAGVSVATVSRVLNNSRSVTEDTRRLVLDVMEKINYQPNLLGRNLRRKETKKILVLLPTVSNPFYAPIVKGMEDVAHKSGYNVLLCNTDGEIEREKVYIELLKNKLADGVIFMSPELEVEELLEIGTNFPVVQCCEYKEGTNISCVTIDNFSAAYRAVKHLIDLGHQKIAYIGSKNSYPSSYKREDGYRSVLKDHGIPVDEQYICYGDYGFESGMRAAIQLLSLKEKPTAIFAISDIMAIGVIKAAKQKGLQVPKDLAVVGFDDINFAKMYDPALTTISQPKYDIGGTAMDILIHRIQGEEKEPRNVYMEHELIIRESSL